MHGLFCVPDVDSGVVGVDVEGVNSRGGEKFVVLVVPSNSF